MAKIDDTNESTTLTDVATGAGAAAVGGTLIAGTHGWSNLSGAKPEELYDKAEKAANNAIGKGKDVIHKFNVANSVDANPHIKDTAHIAVNEESLAKTLKATGKTEAEAKKLASGFSESLQKETGALVTEAQNFERLATGAAKYKDASWYKKPLIAFESMSTSGKVGLVAATTVIALGATWAMNHWRSSGKENGFDNGQSR